LADQEARLGTMNRALNRLVEAADGAPRLAETYAAPLSGISASVKASSAEIRRLAEAMMPLPQLADAQGETMVAMGRQVEESRLAHERSSKIMEELRQGLAGFAKTTEDAVKMFQAARGEAAIREQRLMGLVEALHRRLAWFGWSVVGLAAILVVIEFVGLF
jgi:hypothetical protein